MYPERWALNMITGPTIEPLDITTVKNHLRIDAGSLADNMTESPSINVASSTGISTGIGIDVMGYSVVVNAVIGAVDSGGTVDIHLEESDDDVTYADVVGSTFAQASTGNMNTVIEKEYIGTKQYVRASASAAGAASVYGVNVTKYAPTSPEDSYIESLITVSREMVEFHTGRRLINQTWDYFLGQWPNKDDYISLPYAAPLVSVSSLKYTDYYALEHIWSTDNYIVDTMSLPGAVRLRYNIWPATFVWPAITLYPSNPIAIRYTAGYGASSTDVPKTIKQAMLLIIGDLYENRENSRDTKFGEFKEIPYCVKALLNNYKVWM